MSAATRMGAVGLLVCVGAAFGIFASADRSSQRSAPTRAQGTSLRVRARPLRPREPTSLVVATVAPSAVIARQPWIGVACPAPVPFNAARAIAIARACDRAGLSIVLRTGAVSATATINGQSFKLDSAHWSDPPVDGKHKSLSGFLQPARFLHGPFKTVTFRNGVRQRFTIEHVHLVVAYGAGREVQTSLTELGYGGWG
jgi:hypothetical protein